MKYSPYSELDEVILSYAKKMKDILVHNFVGFYLQGSLAIGDFDMTSDVDFIVVINHDLSDEEVHVVQEAHNKTHDQDNRWVKRMEYSFFPKNMLNVITSPFVSVAKNNDANRLLWYFDNGSRRMIRSDHCNTLVTRWTLREKGIVVLGEDIKKLVNPVNPDRLKQEIKNTMLGWSKEIATRPAYIMNRFYQSYLVLNYARMLQDLFLGKVTSKKEGMTWAKGNLDTKWYNHIDFCWKERQDSSISITQPHNPKMMERTLDFVRYVCELAKAQA